MDKQLAAVILILIQIVGVVIAFMFLGPFFGVFILLKTVLIDVPETIKDIKEVK